MRRAFALPEEDQNFLNEHGYTWETVIDGSHRWLIVHNVLLPDGYVQHDATAAFLIETHYPDTQIDMVYFCPPISRIDGKVIGALADMLIDGYTYQRWSRHRTAENPWRPGLDDVSTHLDLVRSWLEREFTLRPTS